MQMVPVSSSDLASVGYDPTSKTLYISFKKGGTYSYSDVPESVYRKLLSASSKGRYFSANIKKSYNYSRIG